MANPSSEEPYALPASGPALAIRDGQYSLVAHRSYEFPKDRERMATLRRQIEATLLKAGVNAELHVFSKGGHGFGLGKGRGESTALWPTSFAAWLRDCGMIAD